MAPRRETFRSSSTGAHRTTPTVPLDTNWRGSRYTFDKCHGELPAMMDPQHDDLLPRPSLLAFRPSRMLRASQQLHQNTVYKQHLLRALDCSHDDPSGRSTVGTVSTSDASEDDWDEGSETSRSDTSSTGFPSPPVQLYRESRSVSTVAEDEEKAIMHLHTSHRVDRAESLVAILAMPASGPIPLLETRDSEDEDHEIDTIICDPSRLPRTLIMDEDGFTLSRESVMARAANVPRGGVIKSGLLFKQGFGLRAGGWKVRFVVLTSTKMTFFREERGRKRGEIDLAKCNSKSIEIMPRDSVFDGSQATMWRFAIRGKSRRMLFSAYTEGEMKDWLRCLHVALAAQGSGFGRFTDFVVPSGTFLAARGGGLLRSSGNL